MNSVLAVLQVGITFCKSNDKIVFCLALQFQYIKNKH